MMPNESEEMKTDRGEPVPSCPPPAVHRPQAEFHSVRGQALLENLQIRHNQEKIKVQVP